MKTCVIVNPRAGNPEETPELFQALEGRPDTLCLVTLAEGQARELARFAVEQGYESVVAAGGDGTMNEAINGIAPYFDRCSLAIVPMGTGNDFARTIGISSYPREALAQLERGTYQRMDLIRAETEDEVRHYINVASGGFAGRVTRAISPEIKAAWGPLAYLRGALGVAAELTGYDVEMDVDGKTVRETALNIFVANARFCGAGMEVAGTADPTDGFLDVVTVRDAELPEMAGLALNMLLEERMEADLLSHERARRVRIHAEPGMWFNTDGEIFSDKPITFTVIPGAVSVLVGESAVIRP